MKFQVVSTALAAALLSGSALAADLPSRKGPPPVFASPAFSWTGFYAGLNVGYGFGENDPSLNTSELDVGRGRAARFSTLRFPIFANPSENLRGILGGGQIGYNYQITPSIVLGAEADIQGAGLKSQSNSISAPVGATGFVAIPAHLAALAHSQTLNWFGTARARLGFALPSMPNLLLYGTGGLAYGNVKQNLTYTDVFFGRTAGAPAFGGVSQNGLKTGWTVGGGLEWAPAVLPSWSFKAEYLYVNLGSTTLSAPVVAVTGPAQAFGGTSLALAKVSSPARFQIARVGVNYHFWSMAPALVVAKY